MTERAGDFEKTISPPSHCVSYMPMSRYCEPGPHHLKILLLSFSTLFIMCTHCTLTVIKSSAYLPTSPAFTGILYSYKHLRLLLFASLVFLPLSVERIWTIGKGWPDPVKYAYECPGSWVSLLSSVQKFQQLDNLSLSLSLSRGQKTGREVNNWEPAIRITMDLGRPGEDQNRNRKHTDRREVTNRGKMEFLFAGSAALEFSANSWFSLFNSKLLCWTRFSWEYLLSI